MTDLEERIRAIADALRRDWGGTLAAALRFLPTGESLFIDADAVFPTASVIKVAFVAELLTQAEEGRLALDERVPVTDETMVGGSGVLVLLSPGLALPLRDLASLAIAVSDNTAANLILTRVGGREAVNRRIRDAWGLKATTIHRPIRFGLGPDDPPHTATSTAADLLRLFSGLAHGEVQSPAVSEQVLRLLARTQDSSMLPRYLDINPYADDLGALAGTFRVRHKTGAVTGVRNDAGLITRGDETLAVCVLTKDVQDARWTAANAGSEAVAAVGRAACRFFWSKEGNR